MFVIIICERFGWTYYEYMSQPKPFLDLIKEKFKIDQQLATLQANKVNNKSHAGNKSRGRNRG